MRRLVGRVVQCVFLSLVSFVALTSSAEKNHREKALVRFLARSTAVRSTWAGNQHICLVELCTELVELVDEFPVFGALISPSLLASEELKGMRVRRAPECDALYSTMLIRAAASDNSAILPIRPALRPRLSTSQIEGAALPCCRNVRWRKSAFELNSSAIAAF